MALTKPNQSMIQDGQWVFDTVADMVAEQYIPVGARAKTYGYHSVGDGGGNDYLIVAAATGTHDGGSYIDLNTHQAQGLFSDGYVWNQFGAKGDAFTDNASPTDDTAAMQAMLDYLSSLDKKFHETDRNDDGGKYQRPLVKVKSALGAVYGMGSGVTLNNGNRGMVIDGGSFRTRS